MPAFYTHAHFGNKVFQMLPRNISNIVNKYPGLFYIGFQGPDILFYYDAIKKNKVNTLGFHMHSEPGAKFFEHARTVIADCQDADEREAAFSYIAGFICHFTFDSQCHPYIEKVVREQGVSHSEIEAEIDRRLMIHDGKDPLRYLGANLIENTEFNTGIIAKFFDDISADEVQKSLKDMKMFHKLLCAPGKAKRGFVFFVMKCIGKYDGMKGLVINYEENPQCMESTKNVIQMCKAAVPIASALISEFYENIDSNAELNRRYQRTFGE